MITVCQTLISLSRSDTIGQDEVQVNTCTKFVAFKASELINRPRLEPLVENRGFSLKLKQGTVSWVWANNL